MKRGLPDSSQWDSPDHIDSVIVTVDLEESGNKEQFHTDARALPQLGGETSFTLVYESQNSYLGFVALKDSSQGVLTAEQWRAQREPGQRRCRINKSNDA